MSTPGWNGEALSLPATIRPLVNGPASPAPDERDRLLIEAHEKIEQMVHAIPSILIGINPQRRIIHWNQISEKTFGLRREDVLGLRLDDCELPWDRILVLSHIATVLQTKTFLRMEEIGFLRPNGLMGILGLTLNPVLDREGQVSSLLIFGADITERRALEQQLLHASKMEAIGRLAGGVAHDFNNLLMVVIGQTDLLLKEMQGSEKSRQRIEEIKKCGIRAASLTKQLLAFSRKQIIQPQPLNLNEIILDTKKMLKRLIEEDIELVSQLEPDLGLIMADHGQLVQILMNMAVNSRDAISKGGRITISTANVDFDRSFEYNQQRILPGSFAMLAFGDTGEGMTAETKTRIFEPFFTTKGPGKGTGLGLATVYGIVKQCGGFILVYSDPGVGTTFRIYFPRIVSEAQTTSASKTHFPETHGAETILVAEDEPAIRQIVVEMLRSFGYGVIPVTNGQEALRAFHNHNGSIDLLITDAMMPCMGGLELADTLHKERPGLRVLFLSGHSDPASFARDRKIQTPNFLQKPFTLASLSEKVRNLLYPIPSTTGPSSQ